MKRKMNTYLLESDIRRILENNDFIMPSDWVEKQWYMNLVTDLAIFVQKELEKAREEAFEQGYKEAEFDIGIAEGFKSKRFTKLVSKVAEKLKKGKITKTVFDDETVTVKPEYIKNYSYKFGQFYTCKKCGSKCLIPVIHPLVVVCPKCGELELDEFI